jgi:hypothetical protein
MNEHVKEHARNDFLCKQYVKCFWPLPLAYFENLKMKIVNITRSKSDGVFWVVAACVGLLLPTCSAQTFIGSIRTRAHRTSGDVYVLSDRALEIRDFVYDGLGPAAYFWMDRSPTPSPNGQVAADGLPSNGCAMTTDYAAPLPSAEGTVQRVELPEGLTIYDFLGGSLSVWCELFQDNFGEVVIPLSVSVPGVKDVLDCFEDEHDGMEGVPASTRTARKSSKKKSSKKKSSKKKSSKKGPPTRAPTRAPSSNRTPSPTKSPTGAPIRATPVQSPTEPPWTPPSIPPSTPPSIPPSTQAPTTPTPEVPTPTPVEAMLTSAPTAFEADTGFKPVALTGSPLAIATQLRAPGSDPSGNLDPVGMPNSHAYFSLLVLPILFGVALLAARQQRA